MQWLVQTPIHQITKVIHKYLLMLELFKKLRFDYIQQLSFSMQLIGLFRNLSNSLFNSNLKSS